MGREASCTAQVGTETAPVKALLESSAIILRGAIRRHFALATLRDVGVVGDQLRFAAAANRWRWTSARPRRGAGRRSCRRRRRRWRPSSGSARPRRAWVAGTIDDAALAEALHGATTRDAAAAVCLVAVVRSEAELLAAAAVHAGLPCAAMWVVHPKGPAASLGDATVRQAMRARGYVDNKSTAVSAALTATRYTRR